jgi:hypothetical protein
MGKTKAEKSGAPAGKPKPAAVKGKPRNKMLLDGFGPVYTGDQDGNGCLYGDFWTMGFIRPWGLEVNCQLEDFSGATVQTTADSPQTADFGAFLFNFSGVSPGDYRLHFWATDESVPDYYVDIKVVAKPMVIAITKVNDRDVDAKNVDSENPEPLTMPLPADGILKVQGHLDESDVRVSAVLVHHLDGRLEPASVTVADPSSKTGSDPLFYFYGLKPTPAGGSTEVVMFPINPCWRGGRRLALRLT